MEKKPNYFVFSSPYDQEEMDYKSCFIVVNIPDREVFTFCDYIDANTLLSADGFVKHDSFYATGIGLFVACSVVEVHIKEETPLEGLSVEEIADAATRKYLKEHGHIVEFFC